MITPALRFLADEGCDFAVVRALRNAGFDVVAVCEIMPRSTDSDILNLSHGDSRVLLTEDKDFGWLVFVSHADSAGVVLIRFPGNVRSTLPGAVGWLVEKYSSELQNAFIVLEPNQARFSRNSRFEKK
jgi:predicted nuclease of predicted toxin-antitoxin system